MYTVLLIVHVFLSLTLILLVLLQHGKGADAGAAFGGGASGTVFGSQGSASFLSRVTGGLAAALFVTTLAPAIMAGTFQGGASVMDGFRDEPPPVEQEQQPDERGPAPGPGEATGNEPAAPAPAPAPAPAD